MVGILNEGIHQPEFDGLDILCLEVGVVERTHDAAPAAGGLCQCSIWVETGTVRRGRHIVVVGSALRGIVSQIQLVDISQLTLCQLLVGEHLALGDASSIGLGAVVGGDVAGAVAVIEDVVYTVPGQFRPVETICKPCGGCRLGELGQGQLVVLWCRGKMPEHYALQVDAALSALKVVDIRDAALFTARAGDAGDKLCELRRKGEVRRSLGIDTGQHVHQLGDERCLVLVAQVEAVYAVAGRLLTEVVLLGQRLLMQVHEGGTHIKVGFYLVVDMGTRHGLGHHAERIILAADTDWGATAQDAFVHNAYRSHGVVDGVVHIFYQGHTACSDGHRPRRDTVAQRYFSTHRGGVIALYIELVLVGILLCKGARHGVERVETVFLRKLVVPYQPAQVAPEGLHIGEEDAAGAGLDNTSFEGGTVEPVEHTVGVIIVLRSIHPVKPEELNKGDALFWTGSEVAYAHASFTALVEDVQAEILTSYLCTPQEIDVLHHQLPQRTAGVHARTFNQFHHQGVGVVHTVGSQLSHLIDCRVANHLILESYGQHLVGTQRLAQGDESQLRVERILTAVQQAGTLHFLVVGSGCETCSLHIGGDIVHTADGTGVDDLKDIVTSIGRMDRTATDKTIARRVVLAKIGQGKNVPVIGHRSTHIGTPYLHPDDTDRGIGCGERGHRLVVIIIEILRDEVVSVFLILVGADLELTCRGTALHPHVFGTGLFLRPHGIHRQFAELQLGMYAEQLLAAVDKGGVQGEGDIGRLEQLDNIVLLALIFQLYLVLEVECGLGVPVDVKIEEVANLGIHIHLYVLVEIEGGHTAAVGIDIVVIAEVVHYLERQISTARRVDADIGYLQQAVHLLTDLAETGDTAQQAVVRGRVGSCRPLVPVFLHQLVQLVVLIFVKGHILTVDDHVAQPRHLDIRAGLGIILHGGHGAAVRSLGIRCASGSRYQQNQQQAHHHPHRTAGRRVPEYRMSMQCQAQTFEILNPYSLKSFSILP